MDSPFTLIIDFDSTIISVETLEYLAEFSLSRNPNKDELLNQISNYTNLAMNGEISFQDSLKLRFSLMKINYSDIENVSNFLSSKIDRSFIENINFFKKNIDNIYIVSGGFYSIINSVLHSISDIKWNIHANSLLFNNQNQVKGIDVKNPLSFSGGKVEIVKSMNLDNDVIVIGDGYTDYEIKKSNIAKYFLAYTGHAKRDNVIKDADFICKDFYEVINFLNNKYTNLF